MQTFIGKDWEDGVVLVTLECPQAFHCNALVRLGMRPSCRDRSKPGRWEVVLPAVHGYCQDQVMLGYILDFEFG